MPTLSRPKFQEVLPAMLLDEGRIFTAELSVLPVMSGGGQLNNGGKFEKIINYSAFYLVSLSPLLDSNRESWRSRVVLCLGHHLF